VSIHKVKKENMTTN